MTAEKRMLELEEYDAGYLPDPPERMSNAWWQDAIRNLLGNAYKRYVEQHDQNIRAAQDEGFNEGIEACINAVQEFATLDTGKKIEILIRELKRETSCAEALTRYCEARHG